MSFKAIQSVPPSFHRTSNSQPFVVSLRLLVPILVVINVSCSFTVCSLDRCPMISFMSTWRLPLSSICVNRFSAMLLAANDVRSPCRYSTLFILVSKMEFSLAKPIGRPFASFSRFVTLANLGSKLWGIANSMFRYCVVDVGCEGVVSFLQLIVGYHLMEFLSKVWVLLKWVIIPIVGLCLTALQYCMFAILGLSFIASSKACVVLSFMWVDCISSDVTRCTVILAITVQLIVRTQ